MYVLMPKQNAGGHATNPAPRWDVTTPIYLNFHSCLLGVRHLYSCLIDIHNLPPCHNLPSCLIAVVKMKKGTVQVVPQEISTRNPWYWKQNIDIFITLATFRHNTRPLEAASNMLTQLTTFWHNRLHFDATGCILFVLNSNCLLLNLI